MFYTPENRSVKENKCVRMDDDVRWGMMRKWVNEWHISDSICHQQQISYCWSFIIMVGEILLLDKGEIDEIQFIFQSLSTVVHLSIYSIFIVKILLYPSFPKMSSVKGNFSLMWQTMALNLLEHEFNEVVNLQSIIIDFEKCRKRQNLV